MEHPCISGLSPRSLNLSAPISKDEGHLEEIKYDHIVLGEEQELFFSHPLSPGSWFFEPKGAHIYHKLMCFIKHQHIQRGYDEVITPNIASMQLWDKCGQAEMCKEKMFALEIEKMEFGLKSMNCLGHCLMFQHKIRSYRELPLRLVDYGVLHRDEANIELNKLTSPRRLQQDDAHIFCRESQVKNEVRGVLEFIKDTYSTFGLTYSFQLSKRPESYAGDLAAWEKAETALTEALITFDTPWEVVESGGACHEPKIVVSVSDVFNKKHHLATIHLDFQLPARFELNYASEGDEGKRETPVIIHATILGSFEQMIALLLEHYQGKWPFWLSPCQAIVYSPSNISRPFALQVRDQIHQAGYYVDLSDEISQEKVQQSQKEQYHYIVIVGEHGDKITQVSLMARDKEGVEVMTVEALLQRFKDEFDPLLRLT